MEIEMDDEVAVPPQYSNQPHEDLRHSVVAVGHGGKRPATSTRLSHYPGGRKRSRNDEEEAGEEAGEAPEDDEAAAEQPSAKRTAYEGTGAGKLSGRTWKAPGTRASNMGRLKPPPSNDWEMKMKAKEEKKQWQQRVTASKAAIGAGLKAKREQREAAVKRKAAGDAKNIEGRGQRVSNPKKIAKMSKKNKAKLKKIPGTD